MIVDELKLVKKNVGVIRTHGIDKTEEDVGVSILGASECANGRFEQDSSAQRNTEHL